MASRSLPPRQKMINMMYLVLTAILALNVSKEVLDSFTRLDADLVRSGHAHEMRSANEYDAFAALAERIPEKYRAPYAQATVLRYEADSLVRHIERMKALVMAECEGLPMDQVLKHNPDGTDSLMASAAIDRKDDRDALTRLLVGSEPGEPKQGANTASELKQRVAVFRAKLMAMTGEKEPRLTASIEKLFDLADQRDASGTLNNWESLNFYDVPVVAGIASLSKLQTDIRSAEMDVLKWMLASVEAGDAKVDRLMAAVIPQSHHVMVGDSFRASVFLAAYDSRNTPEILYDGAPLPIDADGRAMLRLPANGLGERKGSGTIRFRGPNGPLEFPYVVGYQVVAPTLVASPTKMNVLYRFVENPIDLSVPGVPAERMSAAISNGSIVRGPNGSWIAKPGAGNDARVEGIVTMPEGGTRRIGPVLFRVKDLPAPSVIFLGKNSTDTKVERSLLQDPKCVSARLVGSEFDVQFEVLSFELQIMRGNQIIPFDRVQGGCPDEDMKTALKALKRNDRVFLMDVKVRLRAVPNGPVYTLPSVNLKVV